MRRRDFFVLVAGIASGSPRMSWAQQTGAINQQERLPVVAFMRSTSKDDSAPVVRAFRQGLADEGITDVHLRLEFRWGDNHPERLPLIATELLGVRPSVFVGDAIAMLQVKRVTSTIPIIFVAGGDPIGDGLVTRLNRPERNVTGVYMLAGTVGPKRLELLRELVPNAATIGMLVKPNTANTEAERIEVEAAARSVEQRLLVLDVNSDADIEPAFRKFSGAGVAALLVGSSAFLASKRRLLVHFAAQYSLPAIYHLRQAVDAGGLMSYGGSFAAGYRQAGIYAARVLKGSSPGELPVIGSNKPELVINLKTAKGLGLTIPPMLLARADEVIE